MPSSPVQEFSDLLNNTPSVYLSRPDYIQNLAQQKTTILKHMLGGGKDMMRGTPKMVDTVLLNPTVPLEFYRPGDTINYSLTQSGTKFELGWRMARRPMVWTEAEILLQAPATMRAEARGATYKRVRAIKEADFATSFVTGLENALLATPHGQSAEMEADGGTRPYSIFAFVNEDSNALPDGWSTVMGINRASVAAWRPHQATYNKNDIEDVAGAGRGLLDAMTDCIRHTTFENPGLYDGSFQETRLNRRSWIGSANALKKYERILLNRGERLLRQSADPSVMNTPYAGIPVRYIQGLDSAAIYAGSARTTEEGSGVTHAGPRLYLLDFDVLKFTCFEGKYFEKGKVKELQNQPGVFAQDHDLWFAVHCRNPRQLAVASPAAA